MTTHAERAVDGAYAAHGDAATFQASDAGAAHAVRVIDNRFGAVLAQDASGQAGMVQLRPRVNVRIAELGTDEPEGGTLVIKGATYTVETSLKINEFERELTLAESA